MNLDYDKLTSLIDPILDYCKELRASDRVRVASYVASLVDSIQQGCVPDKLKGFKPGEDDSLSFQLHCDIDNLIDELDMIADTMDEQELKANLKASALEKLTEAERKALGV